MTLDLDRITHPLRLAAGSHRQGSGKGCAMNVISYINGDTMITDFPECSARPLAHLVQALNDRLADQEGFLSPENSVLVLDLAWLTVGTAGPPREVVWRWLADLLVDPAHGVVRYTLTEKRADVVRRVAALCVREAYGDAPRITEWREARAHALAAADGATHAEAHAYAAAAAAADGDGAAAYAYAAAYTAADGAAAYAYAAVYAHAADAAYADAYATADADAADAYAAAYAAADFTRWAITHWRDLAELDQPADITPDAVDGALARF